MAEKPGWDALEKRFWSFRFLPIRTSLEKNGQARICESASEAGSAPKKNRSPWPFLDNDMSDYIYQATEHFETRLEKIREHNPGGYIRIKKVIDRILVTPNIADGQMRGPHRGKFKKYVGRREYRLIYYYCEMCRKANRRLGAVCDDCEILPDQSVIFFDVYHKNEKERLNY